jgi:hypothetical protein
MEQEDTITQHPTCIPGFDAQAERGQSRERTSRCVGFGRYRPGNAGVVVLMA